MLVLDMRRRQSANFSRRAWLVVKPKHILRQHLFFSQTSIHSQASIFRNPRHLFSVRDHHSLAEAHHPDRDATGLPSRWIAQIETNPGRGGGLSELIRRQMAVADHTG